MDRQKLDLLTAQANALGTALSSIPDTNESARQRCLGFAQEVRAFVKAWSNLSKALHDPQLEHECSQGFDPIGAQHEFDHEKPHPENGS